MSPRAGVAYFGSRIVRHVAADMAALAERGFTGVLHTFTENDLAYYRETMREIVACSHEAGLEVQIGPWGVCQMFGGEAESRFTAWHPEVGQVLDDGRGTPSGCPNNPRVREFVHQWIDAAIDTGADRIFCDEPHWVHPEHFGLDPRALGLPVRALPRAVRPRFPVRVDAGRPRLPRGLHGRLHRRLRRPTARIRAQT